MNNDIKARLIHTTNKKLQKYKGMQGYLVIDEVAKLLSVSGGKLHTSKIVNIEKTDDKIKVYTKNSIYILYNMI